MHFDADRINEHVASPGAALIASDVEVHSNTHLYLSAKPNLVTDRC
ncbi:hypothetical protein PSAB6_470088 [Paraburkholderia sabiae]|nr:hypothetical protein PSAB6_470088 [Paraburkholderia sabiae]